MSDREGQLETLLTDVCLCARNLLRHPTRSGARSQLRRACDRRDEFYKAEQAQRRLGALHPDNPPEHWDEAGSSAPETQQERVIRQPFKDD